MRSILALAARLRLNCSGKMDDWNDNGGRDNISKPEDFDKPSWKKYEKVSCLPFHISGENWETSDLSMY